MKKLTLLFFFVISNFMFSQTEFKFENGLNKYVVNQKEGISANQLYLKTIEWINKNYKNPDKVILSKIENNYIRIEGIQSAMFCISSGCQEGKYQIEISFKDGKYKFEIFELKQNVGNYNWVAVDFNSNKDFYFDNNALKKKFQGFAKIPTYFNSLNRSLSDYISGNNSTNNDW